MCKKCAIGCVNHASQKDIILYLLTYVQARLSGGTSAGADVLRGGEAGVGRAGRLLAGGAEGVAADRGQELW